MKLIIANSVFQLLEAIQLKRTILVQDKVNLILSNLSPTLREIYDRHVLEDLFEHVNYVEISPYNYAVKLFLNPYLALKYYLKEEPILYTDIFFWNNDYIIYNYMKWYHIKKNDCKYHLYGDAASSYIIDAPDHGRKGIYRKEKKYYRLKNYIDINHFDYESIAKKECDYYIFKKDLYMERTARTLLEIPPIDVGNQEICQLLNLAFGYKEYRVKQKFIYLDTARNGFIKDEDVYNVLRYIVDCVGKDNLLIKPHPRNDLKFYERLGVELFDKDVPWEVFCLNNDISDKVIICEITSAAVMPYLLFDYQYRVISVLGMIPSTHPQKDLFIRLYNKINEKQKLVEFVENQSQLENALQNA